jgi:isocitrate/isopropylmalate dehydrogenase
MTERTYRIALIPGDGVGKEVVPAARQVLEALPLPLISSTWTPAGKSSSARARRCRSAPRR